MEAIPELADRGQYTRYSDGRATCLGRQPELFARYVALFQSLPYFSFVLGKLSGLPLSDV